MQMYKTTINQNLVIYYDLIKLCIKSYEIRKIDSNYAFSLAKQINVFLNMFATII